jgi:hypothetical protein
MPDPDADALADANADGIGDGHEAGEWNGSVD